MGLLHDGENATVCTGKNNPSPVFSLFRAIGPWAYSQNSTVFVARGIWILPKASIHARCHPTTGSDLGGGNQHYGRKGGGNLDRI